MEDSHGSALAYDGKPVTLEQMYWRFKMIRDKYKSAEVFNEWYPRDDETCFRAADGSVFKDDATYLENCVRAAEADGKKLLPAAGLHAREWRGTGGLAVRSDARAVLLRNESARSARSGSSRAGPRTQRGKFGFGNPRNVGTLYDRRGYVGRNGQRRGVRALCCVTCGAKPPKCGPGTLNPIQFTDASVHLAWWYNTALSTRR